MNDDVRLVESQNEALATLLKAIEDCLITDATPGDIFTVVRKRVTGDESIVIDGPAFEHLSDREARNAIRTGYRILAEGATLSFTDSLRNEDGIRELCRQADISDTHVEITGEAHGTRVAITKSQS